VHGFGCFSEVAQFGCGRKSLQVMQIEVDVHVDFSILFFASILFKNAIHKILHRSHHPQP
jgi:hypothetical protein